MSTVWQTKADASAANGAGTPLFMSPEQLKCERADRRADLWAVGVLLFNLVTGSYPFGVDAETGHVISSNAAVAIDVGAKEAPDVRAAIELIVRRNNATGNHKGRKMSLVSEAFAHGEWIQE